MEKEHIIELNIGIYESIRLKINRLIVMDIVSKFPQLSKISEEKEEKDESEYDIEKGIGLADLYEISVYGLYKMANALNKDFKYEKAREIFRYASKVATIIDGEKRMCDMILVENIMQEMKEVFTKNNGEEVQVVEFKME